MKTAFNIPAPVRRKYGITENKKAELDHLTNLVTDAQHKVEELQAIVTALTSKSTDCDTMLALTANYRTIALNNNTLVAQVIQNALSLFRNSDIAFLEVVNADSRTKELAKKINTLVDMLIFSAQVINKLANQIVRQKALNPLISDELIALVSTAGTDANSAVALTLTALNSTFAAQASCLESEACSTLEFEEAVVLYEVLTGTVLNTKNAMNVLNGKDVAFTPPELLDENLALKMNARLEENPGMADFINNVINFENMTFELVPSKKMIGKAEDYIPVKVTGSTLLINYNPSATVNGLDSQNLPVTYNGSEITLATDIDGPWYRVELESSGVKSLQRLLSKAFNEADEHYNAALRAKTETLAQLNMASSNLATAQVNLNSMQSGLAAANAAAYAA